MCSRSDVNGKRRVTVEDGRARIDLGDVYEDPRAKATALVRSERIPERCVHRGVSDPLSSWELSGETNILHRQILQHSIFLPCEAGQFWPAPDHRGVST